MAHNSKKNEVFVENGGNNISGLPDGPLEYILSFLSTCEAVQTCALSRRWSYLWKYVMDIRITGESTEDCCKLLEHVLISRELRVYVQFEDDFLKIANQTIISKHLRRLDLDSVTLNAHTVDFSNCPTLEELEMFFCNVEAKRIISKSLKRLSIERMNFEDLETDLDTRIRISVPSVVSLKLVEFQGWTPLFDSMPSLVDATIKFDEDCFDSCDYSRSWDCGNEDCVGC